MAERIQVFISSTSDLIEERQEIADKLPRTITPYLYEKDRARRASPEEWCKKQINDSKVFVGILGGKWGTPYPAPRDEGSIVQWEFEIARDNPDLEVMTFIKKLKPEEVEANQQKFIDELSSFKTGVWRDRFGTKKDLVIDVLSSILGWHIEYVEEQGKAQAEVPPKLHKYLAPISVIALLIIALALVLSLEYRYPPISIVISCGICGIVLAGGYLLMSSQMGGADGRNI
jgi:hypothetical protein